MIRLSTSWMTAPLAGSTSGKGNDLIGWAASLALHLLALGIAASIGLSLPDSSDVQLDGVWSPDIPPFDLEAEAVMPLGDVTWSPGGRRAAGKVADAEADALIPDVRNPLETPLGPRDLAANVWSPGELASPVGESRRSHGQGEGQGDGEGDGAGFFGIPFDVGQRIVYVVDNSLSMNHKHDSPAKTRFKRVQVELVNSIWHMQPTQQFYVIFFNQHTAAMPAQSMQPATMRAKESYLTWVATTTTSGAPTDPRKAMAMALDFRPDIIYFLTDGEFTKGANYQLRQIKQARTAIHTFSIGEKLSEGVLIDIAKNNGGKYTYIP